MTVRQVAEKMCGKAIPEPIHMMAGYHGAGLVWAFVTEVENIEYVRFVPIRDDLKSISGHVQKPDISDRPASSFIGFFGEEFDRIAQEGECTS